MLTVKTVTKQLPDFSQVAAVYKKSFPAEEQMPFWLMRLFAVRKRVDFLAFYDQEEFCGLTYLVHNEQLVFVFYLATAPNQRSKGYGSQILNWIQTNYPQQGLVLTIETVDAAYADYAQRKRRQSFYFKNGLRDTGYRVKEFGVLYDVLTDDANFSFEAYQKLLKDFSFGFYSIKPGKEGRAND